MREYLIRPQSSSVRKPSHIKPLTKELPDDIKVKAKLNAKINLDGVKVHYNSELPFQIGARAYTQGRNIFIASGQEDCLEHEVGHVIQQLRGEVNPNGGRVLEDQSLESAADTLLSKKTVGPDKPIQDVKDISDQNMPIQMIRFILSGEDTIRYLTIGDPIHAIYNTEFENGGDHGKRVPLVFEQGYDSKEEIYSLLMRKAKSADPIGENENIILEGHGEYNGIECFDAEFLGKIAAIIPKQGGNINWKGKILLYTCQGIRFAQRICDSYYKESGGIGTDVIAAKVPLNAINMKNKLKLEVPHPINGNLIKNPKFSKNYEAYINSLKNKDKYPEFPEFDMGDNDVVIGACKATDPNETLNHIVNEPRKLICNSILHENLVSIKRKVKSIISGEMNNKDKLIEIEKLKNQIIIPQETFDKLTKNDVLKRRYLELLVNYIDKLKEVSKNGNIDEIEKTKADSRKFTIFEEYMHCTRCMPTFLDFDDYEKDSDTKEQKSKRLFIKFSHKD